MEELLAQERAAYQYVSDLMKSRNATPDLVNQAFHQYRPLCLSAALAVFPGTKVLEDRMWQLHSEGRKYFSSALRKLRKSEQELPVETRKMIKEYLRWIKTSQSCYRDFIFNICQLCNGVPQFNTIAHKLGGPSSGESQQQCLTHDQYETALNTVHRSLVYLGDLSRYRATEKLDKEPDFGPAVGYYDLADATIPKSGLGHHQQAIVPRDSKNHLLAIYHLYRSISVEMPHPLGSNNLILEFGKIDAAWARNELIQKGPPKDKDAPHRALLGFFVRLHSMCYKGAEFPAHHELEREILGHLTSIVKQCTHVHTVMRMVITNIAAQSLATERYQREQFAETMQSFYFFLNLNLKTFTVLLRLFYEDLRAKVTDMDHANTELPAKLTPLARYLLPVLRIYNYWLNSENNLRILIGLKNEEVVQINLQEFWATYARTIDLVAQTFEVWELDDIPEVEYMLEEDAGTLAFLPLLSERTKKAWYSKQNGGMKPRFSDLGVNRRSEDDEMLCRVVRWLGDGADLALYLAQQDLEASFKLKGTRFFSGDEESIEELIVKPVEMKPPEPPKPISYAAMAASAAKVQQQRPAPIQQSASVKAPSRDAQAENLSRMVDDLVDDDDGNHPVTPPQQAASNPAVVANGELPHMQDSVHDLAGSKTPANHQKSPLPIGDRPRAPRSPYSPRPGSSGAYHERMHGMSRIWEQSPYSSFPSGLPTGTLGSPAVPNQKGHSRVNSASSIRSRGSFSSKDSWATKEAAPRNLPGDRQSSLDQIGMGSPLLFGAGMSPWSTGFQPSYRNVSPPHGQGG